MKNLLRMSCLLLLFIVGMNKTIYASHMVGADLTYTCTSTPGVWHITLTFYRDCTGIPVCSGGCGANCSRSVSIIGADGSCNGVTYASNVSLSLTSVSDVNINPLCPNAKSICDNAGCVTAGTYTPGIEKYVFEGDIDFSGYSIPSSCCKVNIVFQESARNGAIQTGSAGQNFYITALIDRCTAANNPCNSSPVFTNDPFALICSNEKYMFNNGAVDPDGDSLSYAFVPALQSAGTSVTYVSPYSYDKPMPYTSPLSDPFPYGIRCNDTTGDIGFTPQISITPGSFFVGVVAVEVTQWRYINGVATMVGQNRRDIQMMVQSCASNNSPTFMTNPYDLDANNSAVPKMNWSVYANQTLCFDIIAKDTDFNLTLAPPLSDTTYMSWNQALASQGATFLPKYTLADRRKNAPLGGPREDLYEFCWTPDGTMAKSFPYYFTITAKDNRCPKPGKVTRAFAIKVLASAKVSISKQDVQCGKWKVSYTKTIPSQVFDSTLWEISKTPNDYTLNNSYSYTNTQTTPALSFSQPGKYLVKLSIKQQDNPVKVVFTDTIFSNGAATIQVNDTAFCNGGTANFHYQAQGGDAPYYYRWFAYPDTSTNILNSNIIANSFSMPAVNASKRYTLQVRDANGCRAYDSAVWVTIGNPVFNAPDSASICTGGSLLVDKGNNNGNVKSYAWSTGDTTRTITLQTPGSVTLTITDTTGCSNKDTFTLAVNAPILANAGIDTTVCNGDTLTLHASGGQLYQWKNLVNNSIISAKSSSSVTYLTSFQTGSFELTAFVTQSGKECFAKDTVTATSNARPILTDPQQVQVCRSTPFAALSMVTSTNQPGGVGVWTYAAAPGAIINGTPTQVIVDSLSLLPDPSQLINADNWIRYTYTAPAVYGGCKSFKDQVVMVYSNPPVNAGTDGNSCVYDGAFTITSHQNATPVGGMWSGNGVTLVAGNYLFTPAGAGIFPATNTLLYDVAHTYNAGLTCTNRDSMVLTVYPKPATPVISGAATTQRNQNETYSVTNNSGSSYNWLIDNGTINNGQGTNSVSVVFNNVGSGSIKVTESASSSCVSDTANKTITIDPAVGLNEFSDFERFNLYPNPTTGIINIELKTDEKQVTVEVIDVLGKVVKSAQYTSVYTDFHTSIDLTSLKAGMYFISVKAGNKSAQTKFTLK